jgi:hypothetical protein
MEYWALELGGVYFISVNSFYFLVQQSSPSFVPLSCPNSTNIGLNCNVSNTPCDMLQPCENNGSCYNNDTISLGYRCSCPSGFNGTQCQFDYRPCKLNTCWHNSRHIPYFLLMNDKIFFYRYL